MNSEKMTASIVGLGSYLPEKILSNRDLEAMVETSDEWITARTGIKERRIAREGEITSDMGIRAASAALKDAGMEAAEIDMILVATMTPDYFCPSTAAVIQNGLGAKDVPAVDLLAACTGYLYALSSAKAYVESGIYKNVLIVASEKMSAFTDFSDRTSCVLFGDGAAAAVVSSRRGGLQIQSVELGADGSLADLIIVPGGGAKKPATLDTVNGREHYVRLKGKEVFKHAVRRMASSATNCLDKMGLKDSDISWFVPHQANGRIIDALAKHLEIPEEKIFRCIEKYGNTSASSIGIALGDLLNENKLSPGDNLLLVAFGGGLTWGSALLTKVNDG
jgi:3-oxoacyl-[acyl-carrier-protein] synthase III